METPQPNGMWYLHYYANRITTKTLGVPFANIEQSVLRPVLFERAKFIERHGYVPHLRRPRSFSEKICHRKLFDRNPLFTVVADKWAVRDYVESRVGHEILNEVYLVTTDAQDIRPETLPDRFVIKATHASGWNIVVDDKSKLDVAETYRASSKFLHATYGVERNERHYRKIPRRLLVEAYLDDRGTVPYDYRFYIFHGRCQLIMVDMDRFRGQSRRFYTRDWQPLDFTQVKPLGRIVEPPEVLDKMMTIAERLAGGFDYMRVDLYAIEGKRIVFGEMTVTPAAGWARFVPTVQPDFWLGSFWTMPGAARQNDIAMPMMLETMVPPG